VDPAEGVGALDLALVYIASQLPLLAVRSAAPWVLILPPALLAASVTAAGVIRGSWRRVLGAFGVPRWSGLVRGAGWGTLLWAAGQLISVAESRWGVRVQANNPLVTHPEAFRGAAELALLFVAAAILAPLAEEVFYRGLLYGYLRRRVGTAAAVAVSALLFALAHGSLTLALPLAAVGAGLALLYQASGSLWPAVWAHAVVNTLSLGFAFALR
jgi:membrane protease YdiL (CAAX protease family)